MSCALETRDAWRFVCIDVIALTPLSCQCQWDFFCGGDESDEQHYIYDFMVCKVFPTWPVGCHMVLVFIFTTGCKCVCAHGGFKVTSMFRQDSHCI